MKEKTSGGDVRRSLLDPEGIIPHSSIHKCYWNRHSGLLLVSDCQCLLVEVNLVW